MGETSSLGNENILFCSCFCPCALQTSLKITNQNDVWQKQVVWEMKHTFLQLFLSMRIANFAQNYEKFQKVEIQVKMRNILTLWSSGIPDWARVSWDHALSHLIPSDHLEDPCVSLKEYFILGAVVDPESRWRGNQETRNLYFLEIFKEGNGLFPTSPGSPWWGMWRSCFLYVNEPPFTFECQK